ncbi:hypothetical protein HYH03_002826 [Edaphochlamys debaryana]|uniref:Protein kinase domain-containing protein n=1 Tax=Edaphochlamys debaryana TaxID=47281 RepID=A0A835YAC5_9CHLO|nr:hypothetical protein HYH03_002826 [Edaphochlamys debaryana]|eukprot:KAG2499247.1 hypothetical protein HYH03_002826 [Edaphochlamys debaryana]
MAGRFKTILGCLRPRSRSPEPIREGSVAAPRAVALAALSSPGLTGNPSCGGQQQASEPQYATTSQRNVVGQEDERQRAFGPTAWVASCVSGATEVLHNSANALVIKSSVAEGAFEVRLQVVEQPAEALAAAELAHLAAALPVHTNLSRTVASGYGFVHPPSSRSGAPELHVTDAVLTSAFPAEAVHSSPSTAPLPSASSVRGDTSPAAGPPAGTRSIWAALGGNRTAPGGGGASGGGAGGSGFRIVSGAIGSAATGTAMLGTAGSGFPLTLATTHTGDLSMTPATTGTLENLPSLGEELTSGGGGMAAAAVAALGGPSGPSCRTPYGTSRGLVQSQSQSQGLGSRLWSSRQPSRGLRHWALRSQPHLQMVEGAEPWEDQGPASQPRHADFNRPSNFSSNAGAAADCVSGSAAGPTANARPPPVVRRVSATAIGCGTGADDGRTSAAGGTAGAQQQVLRWLVEVAARGRLSAAGSEAGGAGSGGGTAPRCAVAVLVSEWCDAGSLLQVMQVQAHTLAPSRSVSFAARRTPSTGQDAIAHIVHGYPAPAAAAVTAPSAPVAIGPSVAGAPARLSAGELVLSTSAPSGNRAAMARAELALRRSVTSADGSAVGALDWQPVSPLPSTPAGSHPGTVRAEKEGGGNGGGCGSAPGWTPAAQGMSPRPSPDALRAVAAQVAALRAALQVAQGLAHLHACGDYHPDLSTAAIRCTHVADQALPAVTLSSSALPESGELVALHRIGLGMSAATTSAAVGPAAGGEEALQLEALVASTPLGQVVCKVAPASALGFSATCDETPDAHCAILGVNESGSLAAAQAQGATLAAVASGAARSGAGSRRGSVSGGLTPAWPALRLPSNTASWGSKGLAYVPPEALSAERAAASVPTAAAATTPVDEACAVAAGHTAGEAHARPAQQQRQQQEQTERDAAWYGAAANVYSFGQLLFHLVVGRAPFYEMHPAQILVGKLTGDLVPAWPEDTDAGVRALGVACVRRDPAERPSMEEVVPYVERALRRVVVRAARELRRSGGLEGA